MAYDGEVAGLQVSYDGVSYVVELKDEPLTIGRAPSNGLSLTDASVSWQHAVVRRDQGEVWIRDLDSTNGVSVSGARIRGEVRMPRGEPVLIGDNVTLELVASEGRSPVSLVVEDIHRGRQFALLPGRTDLAAIGVAPSGVIAIERDGSLTLLRDGVPEPVLPDEVLTLQGARFRVRQAHHEATRGQRDEPWPYRLSVLLDGAQGPVAELLDRPTQRMYTITAENRAVLLYLLARQARDDHAAGVHPDEAGWCHDDQLRVGIWGKGRRSASTLPVLVHRLRKEIQQAGFDHAFLEKGRRVLRARLRDLVLDP